MIHAPVNMGAGWHCPRCNVAWDQGEPEPADCVPSIQGAGVQPIGPEEEGVMRIFSGDRLSAEDNAVMRAYMDAVGDYQRPTTIPVLMPQNYTHAVAVRDRDPMAVQHGGSHYKNLVIQPTEFCMRNGLDFCIGSILKYVSRYRSKNGIEDLRKARHFVEIRERFAYDIQPPRYIAITMLEYVGRNNIRPDDAEALYRLEAYYNGSGDHTIGAARLIREIDTLIDLFA